MLRLLSYLLTQGVATCHEKFDELDEYCLGLPTLTDNPCTGADCLSCQNLCPTAAIKVSEYNGKTEVSLDLGSCISCGLCIESCPTGTIKSNHSTKTAVLSREDLILSTERRPVSSTPLFKGSMFRQSMSLRVVSTGCSACDLEVGASANPIFDLERFGVQIVPSPRFADTLLITGPVPKGMQQSLKRTYEAMPTPRKVIAAGTCAISGGIYQGGYAEAGGVDTALPVDVYIPGCPPHPWSILHGIQLAMQTRDR